MSNALDLDGFKKSLKSSAIDAWMKTEADLGPWEKVGDDYVATGKPEYVMRVTRPGSGGVGGGEFSFTAIAPTNFEYDEAEFTAYFTAWFESIRSTIDSIVEPWHDIPKPNSLSGEVEAAAAVVKLFPASEITLEGQISGGNDELSKPLKGIDLHTGKMNGKTIENYRKTFLFSLTETIDRLGLLARVRHNQIKAQQRVWKSAHSKLAKILEAVEEGMKEVAKGGSSSPESGLGVLKFGLSLLSIVPGGMGAVADAAGGTVEFLENKKIDESRFWRPEQSRSCSAALEQLNVALNGLDDEIEKTELKIKETVDANIGAIWDEKGKYDLKPSAITNERADDFDGERPEDKGEISFNGAGLNALFKEYMPNVSHILDGIADTHAKCLIGSQMNRSAIGLAPDGASPRIDEFGGILRDLLVDLASEVMEGATKLEQVYRDIANLEDNIVQEINSFLAELDSRRDDNPLDNAEPKDTAFEHSTAQKAEERKEKEQDEMAERLRRMMNGESEHGDQ